MAKMPSSNRRNALILLLVAVAVGRQGYTQAFLQRQPPRSGSKLSISLSALPASKTNADDITQLYKDASDANDAKFTTDASLQDQSTTDTLSALPAQSMEPTPWMQLTPSCATIAAFVAVTTLITCHPLDAMAIVTDSAHISAIASSSSSNGIGSAVTNAHVIASHATTAGATSIIHSNTITTANAVAASPPVDWNAIFRRASKRALGGGKAGASAAVVQVLSLMWLRTSMNYQYRYGGNLKTSMDTLWQEGGAARLYQGLPFAIVQGPLTRFGDTAANVGILALLESFPETQSLPLPLKTAFGSVGAGLWRIVLMPIDASKTVMQVEGSDALGRLWSLVRTEGPGTLYQGALAQAAATAVGHFPWFLTYNFLDAQLPAVSSSEDLFLSLGRSAFLGFGASCVSDVCSNSLRVIKTTKQTARLGEDGSSDVSKEVSYQEVVKLILEKDGFAGLFGRGLQTRLLTNSIQGAVFSILWKYFQQTQS